VFYTNEILTARSLLYEYDINITITAVCHKKCHTCVVYEFYYDMQQYRKIKIKLFTSGEGGKNGGENGQCNIPYSEPYEITII